MISCSNDDHVNTDDDDDDDNDNDDKAVVNKILLFLISTFL
jgi:hypothetical protein